MKLNEKQIQDFWGRVNKTDSCWLWTGCKNGNGYGHLTVARRTLKAHRASWIIHHGEIPDGLQVHHNCPDGDNPSCVNPSHLWVGTQLENVADRESKGRGSLLAARETMASHPEMRARGEASGNARLTEGKVREIRRRYSAGGVLHRQLAVEFGVSKAAITFIISRKNWSHVA